LGPNYYSDEQKKALLLLARKELEEKLLGKKYNQKAFSDPAFLAPRGCFVTLYKAGELRGCIGQLESDEPLGRLVPVLAVESALQDRRFAPVQGDELGQIVIEISVLTPPQAMGPGTIDQLLERLRPLVDGVILEAQGRRATFLPQVWEQLSSKKEFISSLCRKAALPADYWREGAMQLYTYQAHHFKEET